MIIIYMLFFQIFLGIVMFFLTPVGTMLWSYVFLFLIMFLSPLFQIFLVYKKL